MTLDDLRDPGLATRMWGYDRDEVDRLLGAVADSVEKLQQRRKRDAAAMEALSREVVAATKRAADAEQRLVALSDELVAAQHAAADAEARAEAAEAAVRSSSSVPVLDVAASAQASAEAMEVLSEVIGDDTASPHPVPLAVRAARAVVLEARARAAKILADAEHRAGSASVVSA
jgi:cell division septum initiation protein DivIVA